MRLLLVDHNIELLPILPLYLGDGAHQVLGQALLGRDAVDPALELQPVLAEDLLPLLHSSSEPLGP